VLTIEEMIHNRRKMRGGRKVIMQVFKKRDCGAIDWPI